MFFQNCFFQTLFQLLIKNQHEILGVFTEVMFNGMMNDFIQNIR